MAEFIDALIPRKSSHLNDHLSSLSRGETAAPLFSLVEFNVTELCNRKCHFCPRVDPSVYPNRNLFLSPVLYEKIMRDLAEINYSGKVLYSAFGEPLLHKELDKLIRLTKQYCPNARVESVTNGDFLTVEKLHWLFDAGLDTLLVSMYDGPEQEPKFSKMREEAGLSTEQVILRVRYLPPEENYGITLSNRAGMVSIKEVGVSALKEPMKERCFYPNYQMMIDYDGTVLLCPHDWGKRMKPGNVGEKNILEIWTSKPMDFARKKLAKADRSFSPCDVCDVKGTLMGKDHFEQWQKYYEKRDGE